MKIDPGKCVACGNCIPICPMGAISLDTEINRAVVHADQCVECYACYRGMSMESLNPTLVRAVRKVLRVFRIRFDPEPDVCPTSAIVPDELTWPRVVRRAFSDVQVSHESTGIHGRGTEEVKTNDVTNRVKVGEAGFTVEFGRPSIGVRFSDIQHFTRALADFGVHFEDNNPVSSLMEDRDKGILKADILDEKVLSAIVEFKTGMEQVEPLLLLIKQRSQEIDSVVSVGVSTRCDDNGESALEEILQEGGFPFVRGKTNLGLGRADAPTIG